MYHRAGLPRAVLRSAPASRISTPAPSLIIRPAAAGGCGLRILRQAMPSTFGMAAIYRTNLTDLDLAFNSF